MSQYEHFDASQFMQDPAFRDWVREETPETAAFWTQWLHEHPEKRATVQQAREWLEAIWAGFDELPQAELQAHLDAVKSERQTRLEFDEPSFLRQLGWLGWSAAASVVFVLGLSWWVLREKPSVPPTAPSYREATAQAGPSALREEVNAADQPRRVLLPDGSLITLHRGSKISYDPRLSSQPSRVVYLTGEAFFEVTRQPSQPFTVYAKGLITKVLGTSFRIRAYENKANVTVSVRTGRVSVFAPQSLVINKSMFSGLENGIVLTPNQQAEYSPATESEVGRLVKSIVAQPVLLHPDIISREAVFTDAPLSQIFNQLEESYGIDILYDEAVFAECLLTARLYDEPLLDKLSLICKTIGASYEVVDARIIVSGPGCH